MKFVRIKCECCKNEIEGIFDKNDFICDEELNKPKEYRAIGCPVCGKLISEREIISEDVIEEIVNDGDTWSKDREERFVMLKLKRKRKKGGLND